MELQPVNPTAEAPAQRFTGDVYLTPIHAGTGASRMSVTLVRTRDGTDPTTWLEPFPDDDYAAADQRR